MCVSVSRGRDPPQHPNVFRHELHTPLSRAYFLCETPDPTRHHPCVYPTTGGRSITALASVVDADGMEVDAASASPLAPTTPPDPARPVTAEHTRAAAAVALAVAAMRAKLMADEQAAEMAKWTKKVLKVQLQRVKIKQKYLDHMDQVGCGFCLGWQRGSGFRPRPGL